MFLRMIDRKEVPSSVTFQYLTAMKYARQKKIEILVKEKPIGALPVPDYVLTRMVLQTILYSKW